MFNFGKLHHFIKNFKSYILSYLFENLSKKLESYNTKRLAPWPNSPPSEFLDHWSSSTHGLDFQFSDFQSPLFSYLYFSSPSVNKPSLEPITNSTKTTNPCHVINVPNTDATCSVENVSRGTSSALPASKCTF